MGRATQKSDAKEPELNKRTGCPLPPGAGRHGPPSYGRVGGVQLPDLRDRRACSSGFGEPVAHLREALLGTWPDVEKWALAAGGLK